MNKKAKAGLAGLVVGGSALSSGCVPAAIIAVGEVIAADEQARATRYAANRNYEATVRAAQIQSGSSTVSSPNNQFGYLTFATCNYFKDFNGNNIADYPQDFVNIKNTFQPNEQITVICLSDKRFQDISYELLDSRGSVVEKFEDSKKHGISAMYNFASEGIQNISPGQVDRLAPGAYRAVWRSQGKLVGTLDFKIAH